MKHENSRFTRIMFWKLGRLPRKIAAGLARWLAGYRKPRLPPDDIRKDIGLPPLPPKLPDWWERQRW
jgi:hypothetical protein